MREEESAKRWWRESDTREAARKTGDALGCRVPDPSLGDQLSPEGPATYEQAMVVCL